MARRPAFCSLPATVLLCLALVGCKKIEVRARCTLRSAGSYCIFQNTGQQPGRGCFVVRVRARRGREVHAETHACSGPLQPGQETGPLPLSFDGRDPFARCTVDPETRQVRDCVSEVVTERVEPL